MPVLEFYSPIAKDFMLLETVTISWKEQQGPHRGLKMADWASANDAMVAPVSPGRAGKKPDGWPSKSYRGKRGIRPSNLGNSTVWAEEKGVRIVTYGCFTGFVLGDNRLSYPDPQLCGYDHKPLLMHCHCTYVINLLIAINLGCWDRELPTSRQPPTNLLPI